MNLPSPNQRVMITGLYAGWYSEHVCVLPDATDEEILTECNNQKSLSTHVWTIVIRTEDDAKKANVSWEDAKPGTCKECPPRIHYVVR